MANLTTGITQMRTQKKKNKHSQRFLALQKNVDSTKLHDPTEAIASVIKSANDKFKEGVDLSVRLGVDPRKGDQNVRGITNLPHGTGKTKKIAVFISEERNGTRL